MHPKQFFVNRSESEICPFVTNCFNIEQDSPGSTVSHQNPHKSGTCLTIAANRNNSY